MKFSFKHVIKPNDKVDEKKIINILLKNRQIKNIKEFLNPVSPLKISLSDFGFKKELTKTLKILKEIKKKDQMIVVYTDYDADGITGGAILWETLHLLSFKTMPYVPDRKKEGYGFSKKGIDNIKKLYNPALIISVDHGITKVEEIKYAKSLGISVIITDHHLKTDQKPQAEAIFHIPELSGAGVAYFFAKEIFQNFKFQISNFKLLERNFHSDYLSLATIGIVADLVSLVGPSRSIVKYGLEALTKTSRVGLRHIIKEAGIEGRKITPYEVGFIIAPRINAVGRLENAIDALRLLCTTNDIRAFDLAHKIGNKNVERQNLVEKSVKEARKQLEAKYADLRTPSGVLVILISDKWHEGIIGLIASKIAEEFYRPTIVLTKNDGFYKGSARSIPSLDITNFLRSLKKHLVDVGGHKAAAGFTIEKGKLAKFVKAAEKQADKLISKKDLERSIETDLKIPLSKISLSLVKSLEHLQPFGIGNPQPTFYSQVEVVNGQLFGKTNNHLKIWVKDNQQPATSNQQPLLELISFSSADQFTKLTRGKIIDVVYTLEINRWGGDEKLRGKILSGFFSSYKVKCVLS